MARPRVDGDMMPRIKSMRSVLLLLVAAGCAGGPSLETREAAELATELAGRTAGPADRCISPMQNESLRIVDRRTVVLERGNTIWVNRLRSECPGLRPFQTLIIETHGGQFCNGDHIRAIDPGQTIPGPICFLGDFLPYRRSPRG